MRNEIIDIPITMGILAGRSRSAILKLAHYSGAPIVIPAQAEIALSPRWDFNPAFRAEFPSFDFSQGDYFGRSNSPGLKTIGLKSLLATVDVTCLNAD